MSKFIKNILNPPRRKSAGQIWHSHRADCDLLVTKKLSDEDPGVYRTVVLCKIVELEDGVDKVLKTSEFDFLLSDRIALRYTQGPVLDEDLSIYIGEIPDKVMEEIISTLKRDSENYYNETQSEILSDILEGIQPLRERVMDSIQQREPIIFKLPDVWAAEQSKYRMPKAASDISILEDEITFWDDANSSAEVTKIIENENILVKLALINDHLYFLAWSEQYADIADIYLVKEEVELPADDRLLAFGNSHRVVTSFNESKINTGHWNLQFKCGKDIYSTIVYFV